MMWQYLEEGGYLHPLFADWYTQTLMMIYLGVWAMNFVFLFVFPFVLYRLWHDKEPGNPETGSRAPLILQIRWRAFRRLFFDSEDLGNVRLLITILILFFSLIYGVYYYQIVHDPNVLSTGLIQNLSAQHVQRLIDFLYRFSFLGVFFIVVTPVVTFGLFTSVLADQRG